MKTIPSPYDPDGAPECWWVVSDDYSADKPTLAFAIVPIGPGRNVEQAYQLAERIRLALERDERFTARPLPREALTISGPVPVEASA